MSINDEARMTDDEGMTKRKASEPANRPYRRFPLAPLRRLVASYAALAVSISSVYLPKRALLLHQAR